MSTLPLYPFAAIVGQEQFETGSYTEYHRPHNRGSAHQGGKGDGQNPLPYGGRRYPPGD